VVEKRTTCRSKSNGKGKNSLYRKKWRAPDSQAALAVPGVGKRGKWVVEMFDSEAWPESKNRLDGGT